MQSFKFIYRLVAVTSLLVMSAGGASAQGGAKAAEQPGVVVAVAPNYPPIARASRAEGEVVVEVKINATGKVAAASAVSGHELLRKSSEAAALRWQFAAAPEGKEERSARLTFVYSTLLEIRPDDPEFSVSFSPPYRVEVKFNPPIVN